MTLHIILMHADWNKVCFIKMWMCCPIQLMLNYYVNMLIVLTLYIHDLASGILEPFFVKNFYFKNIIF